MGYESSNHTGTTGTTISTGRTVQPGSWTSLFWQASAESPIISWFSMFHSSAAGLFRISLPVWSLTEIQLTCFDRKDTSCMLWNGWFSAFTSELKYPQTLFYFKEMLILILYSLTLKSFQAFTMRVWISFNNDGWYLGWYCCNWSIDGSDWSDEPVKRLPVLLSHCDEHLVGAVQLLSILHPHDVGFSHSLNSAAESYRISLRHRLIGWMFGKQHSCRRNARAWNRTQLAEHW